MGILVASIYIAALSFIFLYSLSQLHLTVVYLRNRAKTGGVNTPPAEQEELPFVTIQLPIYNEMYVTERLIDAVAAFDWPTDRFEIQVLDDSTDETISIAEAKVKEVAARGISIDHLRRENREGFKAGALKYGMQRARGEFLAIFDADFLPPPDFLRKTIPWFRDAGTGVVQTRWEHLNENYSLLTRLQAFGLDGHFTVEQAGRSAGNYFLNFNGTAGVWRKKTIEDAGGWQSDTLTEDLDLSYRAQLKNWKIRFLEDIASPAELPAAMHAVKSQQFRWTKGAAENAKKNVGGVLKAKIPFGKKIHALFHLSNSFLFVCLLIAALCSLPMLLLLGDEPLIGKMLSAGQVFMLGTVFLAIMYGASRYGKKRMKDLKGAFVFLVTFPVFLCISMGLSLHNAIATLEGYAGIRSAFIRTPKFNLVNRSDQWENKKYVRSGISILMLLEGLLGAVFLAAVIFGIRNAQYQLLPFHILLFGGFSIVFLYSLRHTKVAS